MRRLRSFSFILSIVTAISLVCIGFSSWTITGTGVTGTFGGGVINSFPVINVEEYVQFDTAKTEDGSGIKCFEFYESGFIDLEGLPSDEGIITVYYIFDQAAYYEAFGKDTATFNFYLRGVAINKTSINMGSSAKLSLSDTWATINTENSNVTIPNSSQTKAGLSTNPYHSCTFEGIQENGADVYFSVEYTFFYSGSSFKTDLYEKLLYNAKQTENYLEYAQFYAHARIAD